MTIEENLCQCGCGKKTNIAKRNYKARGLIKGQPVRWIHGHHILKKYKKEIKTSQKGYVYLLRPEHPRSDPKGYASESLLIAEKALGKFISIGQEIHHVDGNRSNNKNSNLVICENKAYHLLLHQRTRAFNACGNVNWRKCWICKQYDDPKNLYILPKGNSAYHKSCKKQSRRKYNEKNRR